MVEAKFKLLIFDEAQEDTKDLRRYILRGFGAETWKQTSSEAAIARTLVKNGQPHKRCSTHQA